MSSSSTTGGAVGASAATTPQGRKSLLPQLGELPRLEAASVNRGTLRQGSVEGAATEVSAERAEGLAILYEISKLLNTGLNKDSLASLVSLCELGVNPEALAEAVTELRDEVERLREPPWDDQSEEGRAP
mmetsp:Transcript_62093/g.115198  ORF Transcript_62093/g.115198 Transcript_62093/m.115198 type:complete len:130 (+) Transcript_62093:67-456(+)